MSDECPFPYRGDGAMRETIVRALRQVIDPELALGIVDLGLVYGVEAGDGTALVRMTMTSAACPVTELIVADVRAELSQILGPAAEVLVEVCWDPPWSPERMSARARRALSDAP